MITLVVAFVAIFLMTRLIYRIYFHPLSSIPGPRLAAATSLFSAYYDICTPGLIHTLPKLHQEYGPVIRIMPDEVHVSDLDSFNQIYRVGTPFTRIWTDNPFLTGSLESKETLPETKKRREFLSPFFSKTAISRVEPSLHRLKVKLFLDTLAGAAAKSTLVNFYLAFRCLTADLVMDYCFHADLNALKSPDFHNTTVERFTEAFALGIVPTYFPNLFYLLNKAIFALPESWRERYFAPLHGFEMIQRLSAERVDDALLRAKTSQLDEEDEGGRAGQRADFTMFDAMARPDATKGQVSPPRSDMVADGCLMIAAGTDTTANTLGVITWHVSQNPSIEAKLLVELKRGIKLDELVDSALLEGPGFEYLRAVVKEGLRLSYGVPGRITRRVPEEGAVFNGKFVAGGTVITSGIYLQNSDPNTFPDPFTFNPERWLCDAETYKLRDRQMLTFSRGSRGCIGINLAYATLHLTTAHLFRRFHIETNGYTTEQDMQWKDCFVVVPMGPLKGVAQMRFE